MSDRLRISQVCSQAGITKHEAKQWERELFFNPPRDSRGHRSYSVLWVKFFRAVKEKLAEGWDYKRIYYNIKSPDRLEPQPTVAYGPEY